MFRTTRIEHEEEGRARKHYRGNGNGGMDTQPPQKIKSSGEFCILSQMAVGVGDPRRMVAIEGDREIIFFRDKMADLLFSVGLPIPSELHISMESKPGVKIFDVGGYLRQAILNVADELSPEAQTRIAMVKDVADRIGIDIDLSSIVSQSKPQEA
jgi:hypothetical protein